MNRTPINSSHVLSAGYENGVLELEFRDRRIYHYLNVPSLVWEELMQSDSKGRYLKENVFEQFASEEVISRLVE